MDQQQQNQQQQNDVVAQENSGNVKKNTFYELFIVEGYEPMTEYASKCFK